MPAYLVPNLRPFAPSPALAFPTPTGVVHPHLLHASDATLYRGPHRLRSVHTHDVNHLILVTSGKGLFHVAGRDLPTLPHRLFLVDPHVPHTFLGRPSDTTRYCELTLRSLTADGTPRPTSFTDLLAAWTPRTRRAEPLNALTRGETSGLRPERGRDAPPRHRAAAAIPTADGIARPPVDRPSPDEPTSPAPRHVTLGHRTSANPPAAPATPHVPSTPPARPPPAARGTQHPPSTPPARPGGPAPGTQHPPTPPFLDLTPAQTDRLHRIILDVIPLCSQTTPAAELHTLSLLHSTFLLLMEASAPPPPVEPDLLDVADAYLRDHATRPLSLADLSRHVGLTPNYLCRAFAARFGEPPLRRHHRHRLAAALRLLESTDLPMRRVAQLTGFRDEFYFSRVVRAATGKPPATYRRHAWAKA